jgi:hypothetical protein
VRWGSWLAAAAGAAGVAQLLAMACITMRGVFCRLRISSVLWETVCHEDLSMLHFAATLT